MSKSEAREESGAEREKEKAPVSGRDQRVSQNGRTELRRVREEVWTVIVKRRILMVVGMVMMVACVICGCSEADKVNSNISKQADYFECERKITVYNARTDLVILEAEGYMSVSNNSDNELVVTCKVGPNTYKKNYIYLNDYTMYVVEDITGTHTDPYHYKLYFHTEILPAVEVKP